jgi:hypothetical protein
MGELINILPPPKGRRKKGRGRPPHKPTKTNKQKLLALIESTYPTVENCAAEIGISKPTVEKYYKKIINKRRGFVKNSARTSLLEIMNNPDHPKQFEACKFFLNTQEGWSEKSGIEHTSPDGSMSAGETGRAVMEILKAKHAKLVDKDKAGE